LIGHGVNSFQGGAAFRKARQIFSGVAGISGGIAPRSASASAMAFITVCGAAMAPAWPEPFTPSGLAAVGVPSNITFFFLEEVFNGGSEFRDTTVNFDDVTQAPLIVLFDWTRRSPKKKKKKIRE
jgi:hypothetical protein